MEANLESRKIQVGNDPVTGEPKFKTIWEKKSWYVYTLGITGLTGTGGATPTGTDNVTIQANADFTLTKLTFFADIAAAIQTQSTQVLPLVTIQLTDTGSSTDLFFEPIPIPSVFGMGWIPYILPKPYTFAKNATIRAAFANLTAATTYNIYLGLHGIRNFGQVSR